MLTDDEHAALADLAKNPDPRVMKMLARHEAKSGHRMAMVVIYSGHPHQGPCACLADLEGTPGVPLELGLGTASGAVLAGLKGLALGG